MKMKQKLDREKHLPRSATGSARARILLPVAPISPMLEWSVTSFNGLICITRNLHKISILLSLHTLDSVVVIVITIALLIKLKPYNALNSALDSVLTRCALDSILDSVIITL